MTHRRGVERRLLARRPTSRKAVVGRVEAFLFRNEYGSRQWEGEVVAELRPSSALTHRGRARPHAGEPRGAVGDVRRRRGAAERPRRPLRLRRLRADRGRAHRARQLDLLAAAVAPALRPAARLAGRLRGLQGARARPQLRLPPLRPRPDRATTRKPTIYTVDPAAARSGPFTFENPDFNFKSLRLNTVLRWEWRPGSALYAVWTQARENSAQPRPLGPRERPRRPASPRPSTNVFEVKATIRLGD